MKKLFLVLTVGSLVLIPLIAKAEWSIGISGGVVYTQSSIKVGSEYDNPLSRSIYQEHYKDDFSWVISAYLKTDSIRLPWELQPLIRLRYEEFSFDFSDYRHPIFNITPRVVSFAIGINKNFGSLNLFALVGVSGMFDLRGPFIEGMGINLVQHVGDPYSVRPVIAVGANYLFDLGPIKIGPQVTVDIYPWEHGFDLCRDFGVGYTYISVEMVIEFEIF